MTKNGNVLITGASGFIGSTVVDEALRRNYNVWAVVRPTSSRQYLQDERIRFVSFDYSSVDALAEQLKAQSERFGRFDLIVHAAGITKARNKKDFDAINFEQTKTLVDALLKSDTVPRCFVYMSSLSAIGPGDEVNYMPIRADMTPAPNTAYGRSKLKSEEYLKSIPDFPYVILRPTGVYGPKDKDYLILMRMVKHGLNIGCGRGREVISFIYSKDLACIIMDIFEKRLKRKEYNVGDGAAPTDDDFAKIVQQTLGRKHVMRIKVALWIVKSAAYVNEKIAALNGKSTTFNTDKYNIIKQRNWACDIGPLQEDIGFVPQYDLRQGVEETIAWYREHGWI